MEHYVTLFDATFLPQGLALHLSMQRHLENYTLWILCVDEDACKILTKLALPNVRLLDLAKLETKELIQVKATRTRAEYCWTLTPFAPRFVFEADPVVLRVTYLDADLWFRKKPAPLFAELEEASKQILITDHAYAPEYDQSAISGQYCVQFITFTRQGGEKIRAEWERQCMDWCYAHSENGKFGDQKYLDEWPEKFPKHVHVLSDKELALAPWNATRFPYGRSIFFHFHGLRLISKAKVFTGIYPLPRTLVENIYKPYLEDIKTVLGILQGVGYEPRIQRRMPSRLKRVCHWIGLVATFGRIGQYRTIMRVV